MPSLRGALRKSFLERNQRVIGVIATVFIVAGTAGALMLTGGVFANRYHVTAYFYMAGSRADLAELVRLVELGRIEPVIDSRFPLSEAAAAEGW